MKDVQVKKFSRAGQILGLLVFILFTPRSSLDVNFFEYFDDASIADAHMVIDSYRFKPTISFVASATSGSNTITIPASAEEGDLAVLFDEAANILQSSDLVVPDGWTQLKTYSTASNTRYTSSYKILEAGDPGDSITGQNETYDSKVMLIFRLSTGPIASVNLAYSEAYGSTGNPADHSAPAATEPYVACGGVAGGAGTGVDWTSLNPAADDKILRDYTRAAYWIRNAGEGETIETVIGDWGSHTEHFLHVFEIE